MAALIKVDQCLNGHYVNTVYGDSMQHVQSAGYDYYKLVSNNALVATFSGGTAQGWQYSMLKVCADYTVGPTIVQHWCWNAVTC